MSTIRVSKDKNYSVINNTVLNDTRLSWKAKGLAAYLLSKPDDWKIVREHLMKQSDDGETSVRTGLQELEKFGYLVRTRHQNESGRFEWEHTLYETPQLETEKPRVENPPVDKAPVENHALLSTESLSTKVVSTKKEKRAASQASASPKLSKQLTPEQVAIKAAWEKVKKEHEPGCIIVWAKELGAIRELDKEGWTPDKVIECAKILYKDDFFSKSSLSLWTVAKQIGAKVRRVTSAAAPIVFDYDYGIKEADRYVPN